MTYQSVNPHEGKILNTFEELTNSQLETAVETATTCFATWRHTTFAERVTVVARAAAIMHVRVDECARPVTLEMGKLFDKVRGEVVLSADIIDYYAKNGERFLSPQRLKTNPCEAEAESTPLGVLLGVEPWNFPYYQLARFAAPNLMAGNVEINHVIDRLELGEVTARVVLESETWTAKSMSTSPFVATAA